MRIVVDTNVFVSAGLKASSWPAAVVRWLDANGGLLKSTATERQVVEVLQRPYFASKLPTSYLDDVKRLFSRAELVSILETVTACRDPTDDKFLELAVNGRAELIVTGDVDLLVLDSYRDIPIITPAAFGRAKLI